MTDTVRLTVAQALVTYLSRQYSVADGHRRRLVPALLGIFGHGNVAGLDMPRPRDGTRRWRSPHPSARVH